MPESPAANRVPSGAPPAPHEPWARWVIPLSRASLIVAVSILGGLAASLAVWRAGISGDPVDVVGVPLLQGYSESREAWSFYAFVLAALALAGWLSRRWTAARVPATFLVPAGALAMLVPPCLPAWSVWPGRLPAATLAAVVAFLVGSRWRERVEGPAGHADRSLGVGLLAWAIGFPELPVTLLGDPRHVLAAALLALLFRWSYPKLPPRLRGERADWRHAAAGLLVVCGTAIANDRDFRLGVIGAPGLVLGRRAGSRRQGPPALGGPEWLVFVALVGTSVYLTHSWSMLGPVKTVLAVAGGAGGAAVLALAVPPRWPAEIGEAAGRVDWRRWLLRLAIAGGLLANVVRPWPGLVVAGTMLALARSRPRRGWGWPGAFLLSGALMLAFLPDAPGTTLDPFHDGQILSAVWEFESGRPLFAEVFPLRSYEFFVTWLSRRALEPSVANFFITNHVLDALPLAGVGLLIFAWTRHPAWSFATGLAAATYPLLGGRMGLPLLFAALGVAAFRSRSRSCLAWLAAGAWLAAWLGFDTLIPFVGASVLTVLIAGPPGDSTEGAGTGRKVLFRAIARVGWATILVVGSVVPFLTTLGLWQGARAPGAYVWLLLENARNLPAFYGLPIPWGDLGQRLLIVSGLVLVGTWAAGGVLAWQAQGGPRRRAWFYLLITCVLTAHRGLGRSDPAHLAILVYPNLILASLIIFEGLRFVGRRGLRTPLTGRRTAAFAAMLLACWNLPHRGNSPLDVARWIRDIRGRAGLEPTPSPWVLERVGPREYLWEMEGGMANYVHRRHNPTRHAITYTISSPGEQRQVVAELRARPPRLVLWQYMSGSNGIPNPLRYDLMSGHLYRHYRPVVYEGAAYLEPASPGWPGQLDLDWMFNGPLPLGRLPLRWGEGRMPALEPRVTRRQELGPWVANDRVGEPPAGGSPARARLWEARRRIDSRTMNYLSLRVACDRPGASSTTEVDGTLEFAPVGRDYDGEARVSFALLADGAVRPYLIPIGCSPGWSWRPGIERLRLSVPAGARLAEPSAECWQVDEVGRPGRPATSPARGSGPPG